MGGKKYSLMDFETAQAHRIANAFAYGNERLAHGDYQRAHLAGIILTKLDPNSLEGALLIARAARAKYRLLDEPLHLLDSAEAYRKVLALDEDNAEAKEYLAEAEASGYTERDFPELRAQRLDSQPIGIKDCQVGYHPASEKIIVVCTQSKFKAGRFVVRDHLTGRLICSGKLRRWRKALWGRWYWQADFSMVREEGEYVLEVRFGRRTVLASHPFPIDRDVWARMLRLSFTGFFNHRCGQKLPWRDGCNDGPILFDETNRKRFPPDEDSLRPVRPFRLRGGWHDGGNWERHSTNSVTNLFCLLLGYEHSQLDWHSLDDRLPDGLAEAKYGVDYYLDCFEKVGTLNVSTYVHGIKRASTGKYYLTHLYRSIKDEAVQTYQAHRGRSAWVPWYSRLFAPALAKYALMTRKLDRAYARRCLKVALAGQAFYRELEPDEERLPCVIGSIMLGDIYLHKLTGIGEFKRKADEGCRFLLDRAERDGFYPLFGAEQRAAYLGGFFQLIALYEHAFQYPRDRLRREIVAFFQKFLPWFESLTEDSPFGHVAEYKKDRPRRLLGEAIGGHGLGQYFSYAAILFMLGDELLGTDRYLRAAERQVQWLFGLNPVGVSFLGGSGYRSASQHLADIFDNALGLKQIPGFMPLAIRAVETPYRGRTYADWPYYPNWDVDGVGQGYSIYWSTCEGGGMTEGPLNAALAMLVATRNRKHRNTTTRRQPGPRP